MNGLEFSRGGVVTASVPYKGEETNHVQNGILLRGDIHTLFDCGLIAIDP